MSSQPSAPSLWSRYLARLDARPLETKAVTAAFCGVLSELLVFRVARDTAYKGRSLRNGCIRQVFLSLLFRGPASHYWTGYLNARFAHRAPGWGTTLRKVAVHEACYDPFFCICYLFLLRLTGKENWLDVRRSFLLAARRDFAPALKRQYSVWPPIQVVTYGLVPARLQVLFISSVAVLTNAYLAWLAGRSVGGHARAR